MTYITFVSWKTTSGEVRERVQEHDNAHDMRVYISHLNNTRQKAFTHIHDDNGQLVEIINWAERMDKFTAEW